MMQNYWKRSFDKGQFVVFKDLVIVGWRTAAGRKDKSDQTV